MEPDADRKYRGIIWIDQQPGVKLRVWASSAEDAMAKVVAKYGEGHRVQLWMVEEPDIRRPIRDGVDGDDVWPSLSAAELAVIDAIDRAQGARECGPDSRTPKAMARMIARLGGSAIYTFAERVRHYRELVTDIEKGVATDDALLTELGCRGVVEQLMGELPDELRVRLYDELIGPLDQRFIAATIDDDGEYLRKRYCEPIRSEPWWWTRRPSYFPDPDSVT